MALQLDLPLESDKRRKVPPYKAWARSGMSLPYDPGRREHEIAIWLRNLADSMRNRSATAQPR